MKPTNSTKDPIRKRGWQGGTSIPAQLRTYGTADSSKRKGNPREVGSKGTSNMMHVSQKALTWKGRPNERGIKTKPCRKKEGDPALKKGCQSGIKSILFTKILGREDRKGGTSKRNGAGAACSSKEHTPEEEREGILRKDRQEKGDKIAGKKNIKE